MAARCAPVVSEWILHAVARTESDLRPWMLHDNTTHASDSPTSLAAAEAAATAWIAEGHSVDLGLMQINAANLPALGMSIRAALDPCVSLAGGAAVLRAAYGAGPVDTGQQAALLMALSIYNTGSPLKGIMNGYARRVMRHADEVASPHPAVQLPPVIAPDMPPAWDVSATGNYAQAHGAPWLVPLGLNVTGQSAGTAAEFGSPRQTMRLP
ncbi:MAG: lytic transglycosylase domain-containing protein [Acidiphilium sp.]